MDTGQLKTFLSETQAFKLYGRKVVERWVDQNLIQPAKDGENTSKKRYDRLKLEILAKSSNRNF